MMVYLDTSAILAVLDADDQYHNVAKTQWKSLLHSDTILVCSNYILVETYALVQRRLGMGAVRLLSTDIEPIVRVIWVDEQTHRRGGSSGDCSSAQGAEPGGLCEFRSHASSRDSRGIYLRPALCGTGFHLSSGWVAEHPTRIASESKWLHFEIDWNQCYSSPY